MSSAHRADATERRKRDVQVGLLFGSIIVTALAALTISLLFPEEGENGFFSYASVQPNRAFHWAFLTLAAANVVVTVFLVSIAALLLVTRRGWQWVTAGVVLAVLGSAFYAVGVGGWAMVYFFGADSSALDPATATAFIDSVNADAFRIFAAAFAGAITVAIASLVLAVGLWRSGRLPKWVVVLGVAGAIVTFVLPTTGAAGVLVEAPQALTSVMIGYYAWRRRHEGAAGVLPDPDAPMASAYAA